MIGAVVQRLAPTPKISMGAVSKRQCLEQAPQPQNQAWHRGQAQASLLRLPLDCPANRPGQGTQGKAPGVLPGLVALTKLRGPPGVARAAPHHSAGAQGIAGLSLGTLAIDTCAWPIGRSPRWRAVLTERAGLNRTLDTSSGERLRSAANQLRRVSTTSSLGKSGFASLTLTLQST